MAYPYRVTYDIECFFCQRIDYFRIQKRRPTPTRTSCWVCLSAPNCQDAKLPFVSSGVGPCRSLSTTLWTDWRQLLVVLRSCSLRDSVACCSMCVQWWRVKKRPRESVSDQLWWWQRQNDREDKDSKTCFASTATVGSCSASCGLKLSALRPNCAKTIFDEAS